ncbi:MAG: AAA family ATPase, partial [Lentisphaeria bacterium]|nr:AAA family ATPase [Lentisphaeria bacterium]NQZ69668.1 AAA family ATPase [Lentisphaeria bacterium]
MLLNLRITNLALIDKLDLDFEDGLSVLTGETGAGKSIIIDAVQLLFGKRASKSIIRNGEKEAEISAMIQTGELEEKVNTILAACGIRLCDEGL